MSSAGETDPDSILAAAATLHKQGRLAEAERLYLELLRVAPGHPDGLHLLGNLHYQRGDAATAVDLIARAITANPRSPIYHYNLGNAERELGRLDEAAAAFRREIALNPAFAKAHNNLGNIWRLKGDSEAAAACFRRAVELDPQSAEAWTNLGATLHDLRQSPEALECHRHALASQPNLLAAHINYASALIDDGQRGLAEFHLRRALEIAPGHADALQNLAVLLTSLDRFEEAFELFGQLRSAAPDDYGVYRNILAAILYHPTFDTRRRFAEHEQFGRTVARSAPDAAPSFSNSPEPERRLRIGWLSSDFREHPVARNIQPLFDRFDRGRTDHICYSDAPAADGLTTWFRNWADLWRPIFGLEDTAVADLIRKDAIDILVILAGHFDTNRPQVAAWRPAPVQVSFHDPATSGLAAMDYLIADPILVPRRTEERFTERICRLPSYYLHAPIAAAPSVAPPPSAAAGHATFGCFGNPSKINSLVLALWADLLGRLPGSQLLLRYQDQYRSPELRSRILKPFQARGVNAERIHFDDQAKADNTHLQSYARVDVALDTFPFSGSTTTFEALWMGVPVVTFAGDTMAARWSASMLHALHLDELVAGSAHEYVDIAAGVASDPARLARLRGELRPRLARSPLCDGRSRARQLERLLRTLWRRWCLKGAVPPPGGRPG